MFLCNTPHSYKGELDKPVLEHTVTVVFSLDPGFHPIVLVEGTGWLSWKVRTNATRVGQRFSHVDVKEQVIWSRVRAHFNTHENSPLIKNVQALFSNPVIIRHVLPKASSTVLCRSDVLATFIKSLLRKNNFLDNGSG